MSENALPQEYRDPELEDFILSTKEYQGELTIEVAPGHIVPVCKVLKEKLGFSYLADISAIDYFTDTNRFGVSYNLVNLEAKKRIRVSARIADEEHPEIDTVIPVWSGATWYEREAFDMMGIRFKGHPDMRRMYMPEDFEYYPLRKEFPLIGIPGSIQLPEKAPDKGYK